MELELRHLKVVCAIADAGSVTKAAAALGLPQPALTTQLQRIERVFGAPLFERDQRGARPTPLGDLVLSRARLLLPAVHELEDEAARLTRPERTAAHHRIGSIHGPILAGLVNRFQADNHQDRLTTHAAWSVEDLCQQLDAGRLDYALVGICGGDSPPSDGLIWREVAVDPVFVLLSQRHPLAGKEEVELAEFGTEHWAVARGDGGCFDECFATACARAGFTPKNLYEMDVGACLELVESGTAIGLAQGGFRRSPEVVAVPLAGAPLYWRHMFGWHPESSSALHAEQLLGYARASYRSAVARSPQYEAWLEDHPAFGVSHDPVS